MIRDRLGVIAGAHRDHAALALRLGERGKLVQRAALLEGRRELQVLELEVQLAAGEARERVAGEERRALDRAFDARRRGADGLDRKHGVKC